MACNVIDKRLQHRRFPVNISKFLRHLFWILSAKVTSESKAKFVQSMEIIQCVAKTYWSFFFLKYCNCLLQYLEFINETFEK